MKKDQTGIAHLSVLLLLVIVAVVGYAGYKVYQDNKTPSAGSNQPVASKTVQTIKSKADLNSAENSLNSQNIDGDLNPSQFNQDVSSLL